MAQRFKPFISRNIGKITLAAFLTGTVISQQQCQRRIREIKKKEEEYWRGEVEELIHDAEHRGRMDELRRMTEYMVTPNSNTKDGSMKGSRADNKPKLITNIQIPKKEEKTSILFKKSIDNTENKVEQPVDESLDKMEKAMDNLENKMKISAFNLTNKSNKTMDEKSEITIAEQTLSKDAISNDIVITNKEIPQTKQQSKGWFGWFKSNNKSVEPEKQIKIEISTENPIETIKTEEK